jgi:hypothetical protein
MTDCIVAQPLPHLPPPQLAVTFDRNIHTARDLCYFVSFHEKQFLLTRFLREADEAYVREDYPACHAAVRNYFRVMDALQLQEIARGGDYGL